MAKILVAEPEAFFSKFYSVKFKKEGYEVDRETDGRKVYENLNKNLYDLLLINLMLPYKDGFTILRDLKNTPNKDIPVIVITELKQEQDCKKAENLGVKHYFVKNEDQIGEILRVVKEEVGKKK